MTREEGVGWRSLRWRLGGVVGLLLLGLFGYITVQLAESLRAIGEAKQVAAQVTAVSVAGRLIHELQKERGLSSGFLASGGGRFQSELTEQRRSTDNAAAQLREVAATEREGAAIRAKVEEALKKQFAFRAEVDALRTSAAASFAQHTATIAVLFEWIDAVRGGITLPSLAARFAAYRWFVWGKEYTGQERATLNALFTNNQPLEGEVAMRWGAIARGQELAWREVLMLSDEETRAGVQQLLSGANAQRVEEMRQRARAQAAKGEYGVDPAVWFQGITAWIDEMAAYEKVLLERLERESRAVHKRAWWIFAFAGGSALFALAISIWAVVLVRSLLRRLAVARAVAVRLADGDLRVMPQAEGDDEIAALLAANQEMVRALRETIAKVVQQSESLAHAAEQVSATAQSLAQSSSEQAAAV
ncbi:MAG: methyl-accepting chemotaxis protein, partial [Hydrogenophilus sp.]|nr:methyl-accepting chemotaxis protein [Hydrogenophilus sp.]